MTKYQLDDDVRIFVERALAVFDDESANMAPAQQRARYRDLCREFDAPRPVGLIVQDDFVSGDSGSIRIRIFRPDIAGLLGCLVYFHGGGWVVGDLDSHEAVCAEIAHRAGVVVVAVDYRLAPEHPYPAAHEDCWRVLASVEAAPEAYGTERHRIAVGGDSAGANIAAGLALRACERGDLFIAGQVLIYGAFGGGEELLSKHECHDAPLLSLADMHAYQQLYFGTSGVLDDQMAAPLRAVNFDGLPPAFIQAAGYDPLRDESVEYARLLGDAGVPVELHVEIGLVHGFLRARHVTARGGAAFSRICQATRRLLAN